MSIEHELNKLGVIPKPTPAPKPKPKEYPQSWKPSFKGEEPPF